MKIHEMTRRQAIFGMGMAAATIALAPLTGCSQNDKTRIAQLVQVLGQAAANVAAQVGQTDISNQISAALPGVVKAINDWQLGTAPSATAIQALNSLMNLLYLIPPAAPYVGLINLAITTAEALLALIPTSSSDIQSARAPRKHRAIPAPTQPAPQSAKEFKKQYNAIAKANPQTAFLVIK